MANPWAFRRAATALVAQALLWAAPEDARARTAVQRGLAYVLKALDHPTMKAIPPGRKVEAWNDSTIPIAFGLIRMRWSYCATSAHAKRVVNRPNRSRHRFHV